MKFSITIPAYKPQFLKEAVESVMVQSFTDWELIIVDDDSPDDLHSIVAPFLTDSRVRYYRNEKNIGAVNLVDNWNRCLAYCRGDYMICMGDDDALLPDCLAAYVSLMEKYPGLGVYHAWTEIFDEQSRFSRVTASRCEYESVYSFIWHRWNGRDQYIGDFLFDIKKLRSNGGFFFLPLAWGADDLTAIIAAQEKGIANTQSPGFCYRESHLTLSSKGSADSKMQAVSQEKDWMDRFLEREPSDEQARKFWICLRRDFSFYYEKKKALTISIDLGSRSLCRLFHWIAQAKRYQLRVRTLAYAVVLAIKQKHLG